MMRAVVLVLLITGMLSSAPLIAHDDLSNQIKTLTNRIHAESDAAELYFKRGELYRAQGRWKQALQDFDRALKYDPELMEAHLAKGLTFLAQGNYQNARLWLDKFLVMDPENYTALTARAQALWKLNEPDAAISDFDVVLSNKPDPGLYLQRFELLKSLGRDEEALEGLAEGISKLGAVVTLELPALEVELKLKRFDEALQRIDKIAAQAERQEGWLARRGEILEQAGRIDEARSAYEEAVLAIEKLPPARRNSRSVRDLELKIQHSLRRLN